MNKFPRSLLIIIPHLFLINAVYADEHVWQVQQELRKRHLFFGELTGQPSPALSAAVTRYQKKKGFASTGLIDSDICKSLGLNEPVPQGAKTPFVVENSGVARGMNGESLPRSWPAIYERIAEPERPLTDGDQIALARIGCVDEGLRTETIPPKTGSHARAARIQPRKETNPIVMAFHSFDHAIKFLRGDTRPKKNPATKRG